MKFSISLLMLLSPLSLLAIDHGQQEGQKRLNAIVKSVEVKEKITADKVFKFFGGKADQMKGSIDPQKMCHVDESDFVEIRKQTVYPLVRAMKAKNIEPLKKIVSKSFAVSDFEKVIGKRAAHSFGAIKQYNWEGQAASLKGDKALKSLNNYLNKFSQVDDVEFRTVKYLSYQKDRNPENFKMNSTILLTRYDLRAKNSKGLRVNDRGFAKIAVSKIGNDWKMNSIEFLSGETVTSSKPSFTETTIDSGLASIPVYTRNEAIRRGGYAIAVGDYNGDNHQDVYVGSWGAGHLLEGNGKGNFKVVKDSGLEKETLVKTAVFGDFFNTGRQDLLLVRFVPTNTDGKKSDTDKFSDIVFYKNNGKGKFSKMPSPVTNRVVASNAMPGAVSDMNGDGLLDFYVGFPGSLDFTFIGDASKIMQGAKVQGLFLNNGKGSFTDTTNHSLYRNSSEGQGLFPHSALSYDYDQDGDMDIIVLDDRGNLSPIYKNVENGKFVEVADNTGMTNNDLAMGAAGGDLDNDGVVDFAMTNVNFVAAERWQESCAANWHMKKVTMGNNGLRLYKGHGAGNFVEMTKLSGLDWAGEGMAGVEFIDYDNDGLLDIYVANGLWSGTSKEQDLSSVFFRSLVENHKYLIDEMYFGETESDFMRVLNSYKGDIYGGNLVERPSMAGYQRNRLFRNMGKGKFLEVGYLEGVDSIADGYVISKADINEDGKMDIVLRNGDPGIKEVNYPAVQLFINNSKNKNSLLVELEGTKSNKDGVGAFVEATIGKNKIIRHMIANNGTAQSQKALHFGLGKAKKVNKLVVSWPSGEKQVLKNVKKGKIKIVETKSSKFAVK
ncbi:MAG: CRTAC1 family protein [Oligoflexia bacterium]|nr:CRTAC1 family protein [Oligoflexia bacterium]